MLDRFDDSCVIYHWGTHTILFIRASQWCSTATKMHIIKILIFPEILSVYICIEIVIVAYIWTWLGCNSLEVIGIPRTCYNGWSLTNFFPLLSFKDNYSTISPGRGFLLSRVPLKWCEDFLRGYLIGNIMCFIVLKGTCLYVFICVHLIYWVVGENGCIYYNSHAQLALHFFCPAAHLSLFFTLIVFTEHHILNTSNCP